ncbi:permease-like cell division protein FtsX [Actinoplanes philippinensis]|uniref:permease-like cell division protein FtsX n=1 Tax=Actinoplanes philippinensis TaxID=35752 RepID=UPI0033CBC1B0
MLKIIFAALVTLAVVTGCGLFEDTPEEKFQKEIEEILEKPAVFTVFLDDEATEPERTALRAWLEKQPDVIAVAFEDKAAAYERFKQLWPDDSDFMKNVEQEYLPESFRTTVSDYTAVRELRDSQAAKDLEAMPGVRQVVFPCTTVEECRDKAPSAVPRPS